jgi:hypothetical protein
MYRLYIVHVLNKIILLLGKLKIIFLINTLWYVRFGFVLIEKLENKTLKRFEFMDGSLEVC